MKILSENSEYLFPELEKELDIYYKDKFTYEYEYANELFTNFLEDKFPDIYSIFKDREITYFIEDTNKIRIYNLQNTSDFISVNYTEGDLTQNQNNEFSENILYLYLKDCFDDKEIYDFNSYNYIPENYENELKNRYSSDKADYSEYLMIADTIQDMYLAGDSVFGNGTHGVLKYDNIKKILDEAVKDNVINEEVEAGVLEYLGEHEDKFREELRQYIEIDHQYNPSRGESNVNYRFIDLGGRYSHFTYPYEYDLESFNHEKFLSEWITYAEELPSPFDDIQEIFFEEKKYLNVEKTFPLIAYIPNSKFLDIVNDVLSVNLRTIDPKKQLLSLEKNKKLNPEMKSFEKKIQYIDSPFLYRLSSILGKELNYDINKKISISNLKKLAKNNPELSLFLNKRDTTILIQKFSNGFTIKDIIDSDIAEYKKGSIFDYFKEKGIDESEYLKLNIGDYKWKSHLQRISDKHNYVMQLNLKKEYLNMFLKDNPLSEENKSNLKKYKVSLHTVHPVQNSYKVISLGWIRYTVRPTYQFLDIPGVLLDEIQSDLDNDEFLGRKYMAGWQYMILKSFVSYVRKNLGYEKIYLPSINLKNRPSHLGGYGSGVPSFTGKMLYSDLPKQYGFKDSEFPDLYLLEKVKDDKRK